MSLSKNLPTPLVISASRATDIPAFHGQWFVQRLKEQIVSRTNPVNGIIRLIDLSQVKAIVFWTKNPAPFFSHLPYLDERNYIYYFQYTLNNYMELEPKLPSLEKRIESFKILSGKLGPQRVIWRFDPIILGGQWTMEKILDRLDNLGRQLSPYCETLVFSFLEKYAKVNRRLQSLGLNYIREVEIEEKHFFVQMLPQLMTSWPKKLKLACCAQNLPLATHGIEASRCVDGELLYRLSNNDEKLARHFGIKTNLFNQVDETALKKDKSQRQLCRCGPSQDIGFYNSCQHDCVYCYANV